MLKDSHGREISYLRVSVTDRCNLRCLYCTPPPPEPGSERSLTHDDILRYEELERLIKLFVSVGVSKVRLTGGEPLVRRDLTRFAARVASIPGVRVLALTTNGSLLAGHAVELRRAGVSRVNISLDTLDRAQFQEMTGSDALSDVLSGIEAALAAGFERVKINSVIIRGVNDDQIEPLAELAAERPLQVRFLEYMPIGRGGDQHSWTFSAGEILEVLRQHFGALEPLGSEGISTVFRLRGHEGTLGLITPMTGPFCDRCNRLRLTSDGRLKPCLLSDVEFDIRGPLRSGVSDTELLRLVERAVTERPEGHRFAVGSPGTLRGHKGMRRIGG
jgi:cyclic pyranopterin phosphate synthase